MFYGFAMLVIVVSACTFAIACDLERIETKLDRVIAAVTDKAAQKWLNKSR